MRGLKTLLYELPPSCQIAHSVEAADAWVDQEVDMCLCLFTSLPFNLSSDLTIFEAFSDAARGACSSKPR